MHKFLSWQAPSAQRASKEYPKDLPLKYRWIGKEQRAPEKSLQYEFRTDLNLPTMHSSTRMKHFSLQIQNISEEEKQPRKQDSVQTAVTSKGLFYEDSFVQASTEGNSL